MTIQDLRGEVRGGGRWGGHHSGLLWDRQESQDSTARDSGIDTSSCFTSSEDSNRDRDHTRQVGVWQPSSDGRRLVGRMVLRKVGGRDWRGDHGADRELSGASLLGLKVVGGRYIQGRYGAVIEK